MSVWTKCTKKAGHWKRWIAVILVAVMCAEAAPANLLSVVAADEMTPGNTTEHISYDDSTTQDTEQYTTQNTEQYTAQDTEQYAVHDTEQIAVQDAPQDTAATPIDEEVEEATVNAAPEMEVIEADIPTEGDKQGNVTTQPLEQHAKEPNEEDVIEEPVDVADTSAQTEEKSAQSEAKSVSIDEISPLAVSISDGDNIVLSETGSATYYYKFVPTRSSAYLFRSYATVNASLQAYVYDANGSLIAEAETTEDESAQYFHYDGVFRVREVYYLQVDLQIADPESGPATAKILLVSSENAGFSFRPVGEHLRTGLVNSEMTLSVRASSPTELFYQWYMEDEAIEGATSDSYTFIVNGNYSFHCLAWDELNRSDGTSFTVNADNQLSIMPEGGESGTTETELHVDPGDEAQMRVIVSAIDTSQITYQWYRYFETQDMWSTHQHTELLEGETGDVLVLQSPKTGDAYICTVQDQYGSSKSLRFNIYVENDLTVYANEVGSTSVNITAVPGDPVLLHVIATAKDDSQLTYQWYRENDIIEGIQEDSYELSVPQSTEYKCTVSDQYGNTIQVSFIVYVENELTVYAGGTFLTRDDVYVFQGDPAVLNVDVSAIDDSEMTYLWRRRVHRWNAYYDWYTWEEINGAVEPECIIESYEDGDEFSCEVTDRYGNNAVIEFKVHIAEDEQYLAVNLTDSSGNTFTDGFSVSWYAADGTLVGMGQKLHNVTPETQYECRVSLGEDLSYQYVQPEAVFYTSGQNSESFDLQLIALEPVTILGSVSNKAGEKIPGATIRLKQVYNGKYLKVLDAEADDSGAFCFDTLKTKTNLIASADEYYDSYYSVPLDTAEAAVSMEVVLEEIPSNRITLKLIRQDAAATGEEPEMTELSGADGVQFTARNLTRMTDITELKEQFPYVVLGDGTADPGDIIRLFAEGDDAGMTAGPIEVTLDEAGCAETEWIFVQNGRIRIREITGNDENVVFIFDANGKCVQNVSASVFFNSDPLPAGTYTCVLIKKTDVLRNVDTLSRLDEFGLAEGTDYYKTEAVVSNGIITQINGVTVPALNISSLVYTVAENTRLWANRMETATGQYLQMRLMYEIDEQYTTENETVTLEIPEGMTFVERSLTVDGRACGCQIADHNGGHTVTIPVNSRKSILRFYILPTTSGNKNVFAMISFSDGSTVVRQPLGSLAIRIVAASISVPEETGQKTVIATGKTLADCDITLYDNGTVVGTTISKKSGTWAITFDLVNDREYSFHEIYASVKSAEYGVDIETEVAELFYNCNYADLSKVTMINTAHPASNLTPIEYRTVFDFLSPTTAVPNYRYWPKYPTFTFVVEFANDNADVVSDACVVTTNSSGDKTRIDCDYDEEGGVWIGTHDYLSASDIPCKVGVSCNNYPDTIHDFIIDGEDMEDPGYFDDPDLDALIEETFDIENKESTDQKLSYDVIVKGKKIGRYSLEIYDYDSFDVEDWKNTHETISYEIDGNICFASVEDFENTLTAYVIDPGKRLVAYERFDASTEFTGGSKSVAERGETAASVPVNEIWGQILKWTGGDKGLVYQRYKYREAQLNYALNEIKSFCSCPVGQQLNNRVIDVAVQVVSGFRSNNMGKDLLLYLLSRMVKFIDPSNADFFDLISTTESLMQGIEGECYLDFNDRLRTLEECKGELQICNVCHINSSESWCSCKGKIIETDAGIIIDPSGYVYEAVPSNRVSDVKVEVYRYDYAVDEFGVVEDEKSEIFWDAENYDQVNPQYTDIDGIFGWDVPEGQWLVKFSKEGYEDTDSRQDVAADEEGYLPVPPVQTEVNTEIVSTASPEVGNVEAYPDEIRIEFSQYMKIDSVNTTNIRVSSGGRTVTGSVIPLNAEDNYKKTEQFASYFGFVPEKELSGTVTVSVSGVKNYCGRTMEGSYSNDHAVKIMPKDLEIKDSTTIPYRGTSELTIKVVPAQAGANRMITVTSYSPSIVSAAEQTIITDQDGVAKLKLNGNLPGQGILNVRLDGTEISDQIVATVIMGSSTVSLEDGGFRLVLENDSVLYSGKPITPAVSIDGLKEGTDFSVSYVNNTAPGIATVTVTGMGKYSGTITGTFRILPGKTSRGDMFNLADNVKVTWNEVPGAVYYKVYREGITNPSESVAKPVIVTRRLVGWDKTPGLTNGHAYRYKIVASLTGEGDPSGDSPLSYSKIMYRLQTTAWNYVKNTAPGKVTASYKKSPSGDSYVLLYADNEDMVGAKSKVVFGANTTAVVLGGFKKGKTYWFQIRVRKKVNGIDYYTTFGAKKAVKITQ